MDRSCPHVGSQALLPVRAQVSTDKPLLISTVIYIVIFSKTVLPKLRRFDLGALTLVSFVQPGWMIRLWRATVPMISSRSSIRIEGVVGAGGGPNPGERKSGVTYYDNKCMCGKTSF